MKVTLVGNFDPDLEEMVCFIDEVISIVRKYKLEMTMEE